MLQFFPLSPLVVQRPILHATAGIRRKFIGALGALLSCGLGGGDLVRLKNCSVFSCGVSFYFLLT